MGTTDAFTMMKTLVLIAVIGFAAAGPLGDDEYNTLWKAFKTDFKKAYDTVEEHAARFSTFKDNVDFITSHNARSEEHGYTVGINQFADMSSAEFKKTMLTYRADLKKPNPTPILDESNLADSVDWVAKGAVTPVKNQGQCGSCWAFSTTGSTEGAYQIATGKLLSFSEQELVDCAGSYGNQGCNGGLMDNGFKYLEAKGDALESKYSYTGKTGSCSASKSSDPALAKGSVTSFNDVTSDSETQLLAAVSKGPVSVAIEADQSGFQFYKSGVFSGTCGTNLDHGVLVVGYGTDSGKDYWKVKNSWGATWGDKGYIMMARNIANKAGQCGIASQPSYPQVGGSPSPPSPPSPPTPTPTPTPSPPGPSTGPYEDPPCASDEQAVQVTGLDGTFCSPKCKGLFVKTCPAAPAGVTAQGKCVLEAQGSSSPTNCALICSGDSECPKGASCQTIQGTGLCLYPESKVENAETMDLNIEIESIIDWVKKLFGF